MDINPLRYFAEVAKVKNFTRAAENCHVAQPALSQQIRRLETLLGLKLLKRLPRGAALTSEGEILLPYVQKVLNAVQDAEDVAADLRGASRGTLKIVSLPSACVYVLPPKIAAFKRDHPRIDIVLEENISASIPEQVLSGKFDLGVTQSPHPVPGMSRALIHEEDLLLAVPEGHPLALRDDVELSEAAGESFVVTKPDTEFRNLAVELCQRAGFDMHAAFEADHFDSLQAYCAVGMGVALIPSSVIINTLTPRPHYLRISKPEAKRRLYILWPQRGLKNKAAEAMLPYLVKD
ncbi:MAG TPA: LysR family transcriptional regulator [Planctomycetota bacterium]|nr:LysR family transcriptional regulator [Planctomycetota bacterium]